MKKTGLTLAMIFLALCTSMSALAGTTLKLAFTSGNNYIKKVVVTEGTTVHTFDFSKNVNDLGTFQGSDSDPKEIASTEDAEYKAIINAQSGKYQTHSDNYGAQINVGTFMTFDVDGDATVTTTVSYNGTGSLELFAGEVSCGTAEFEAVGDYAIEFTASALPKTAKWDFKAAEPSTITGVNIQGTTGTVASTLEGCEMTVDATNSGKLQYNASGYAQYNKNTIIRIPVATTNDVVTVEAYPGQYKYTVGGVAAEGNTTVHTATAEEVAAGYVEIIATGGAYINSIVAVYAPIVAEQYVPSTWDGKAEVWDFGQAVVEGANNYITADVINDWYKQADGSYKDAAKSKTFANAEEMAEGIASALGWTLPSFTTGDLSFEAGGKTNHRFRTKKENVIRYDAKGYTGYDGYIYSNAGSTDAVYVALDNCKQGDKIEFVLGTNGNPGTFVFANEEGVVAQENITTIPTAVTFMVPEDGKYRVYCTNEKITVARITRTHAGNARVSGTVSALTASDDAIAGDDLKAVFASTKLVFTNKEINVAKEVEIASDGKFEVVNLPSGYTYTVSSLLPDYIVAAGITVEIPAKDGESVDVALTEKDVTLKMIDKVAVSGSIVGMDNTSKLVLVPSSSELFVPEFNISGTTYSVVLQKGVQYTLVAEGVNDYELKTTSMQSDADASIDIEFEKKAVYDITIAPTVATISDLASAKFTFTRLDDKYTYNFTGAENIKLRDGVYSVKVTNAGAFAQLLTSNLVVSGAATTKAIDFKTDINEWNFADGDFVNALSYNGLTSTDGQVNKTYLLASRGTVTIPVKKGDLVTIKGCYQMTFQFEGEEAVATNSKSTGTIETYTYTYNGEATTATITISGTTYFTYISAVSPVEFASTINVGTTREYKTISEALAVVDMMSRPAGEAGRVTIMIDPGNYEEMPVVNSDYVTFKNSASEPSIALKNKGVDIDENAVRITSYYGEGYRYYSCGSDNKWNERVLAVSKDNGECTYECYGGSTNESYWNATVVIKGKNFIAEDIIFENSFNQYVSAKEANDVVVNKKGNNPSGTKVDNGIIRPTTVGSTAVQDKKYVERAAAIAVIGDRAVLNRCAVIGRQDSFYGHTKVRVACYLCELYGATDYIFGSQDMIVYDSKLVMNTSDDKNDQAYLIALKAPSYKGSLFMNCEVVSTVPGVNTASTYKSKPGYLGRPWEAAENATFANVTVDVTDYNYGGNDYSGKSLLVSKAWNSSLGGVAVNSFEYNINYNGAERISGGYAGTELTDAEAEDVTLYAYTEGNDEWDPFAELFAIDSKKSAHSIATPIEEVIADTMVGDKDVVSTEYYSINGQKVSEGFQGMVVKVVRYSDGSKDAIKMMKK